MLHCIKFLPKLYIDNFAHVNDVVTCRDSQTFYPLVTWHILTLIAGCIQQKNWILSVAKVIFIFHTINK